DEYLTNRDPRENFPQAWYKAHFHANQKHLQGIDENWFMTLLFTINTDYYKFLGGINCEFEAINYNLHDLGYRAFRDGAQMAFTE
ncbi:MAG: hypothetical protein NTU97_02385, partial [Candidatus Magasanikbacteria bacterium]|nr:hypothetical protein [Candidatus Magasanikbacteria bacterium]